MQQKFPYAKTTHGLKQIKEVSLIAKAIALLPETNSVFKTMKGEDAVILIAKQAQNVQEDGSVSNLQTPEAAYESAVRSFGKLLVDAAIKANPLSFFVKASINCFAKAFENSRQANIICTVKNGLVLSVNNPACVLLGYTKEELLTKKWSDIFTGEPCALKKLLKEKRDRCNPVVFAEGIKKSGRPFPCSITYSYFIDEDAVKKIIFTVDT